MHDAYALREAMNTMDGKERMEQLLGEFIRLELLVSELYHCYHVTFTDDSAFWWTMTLEEKNHASILKSAKLYLGAHRMPGDLLVDNVALARKICDEITGFLRKCNATERDIDKREAYEFALRLERNAVELHFQQVLLRESNDRMVKILQALGKGDTEHAERIEGYMRSIGLVPGGEGVA